MFIRVLTGLTAPAPQGGPLRVLPLALDRALALARLPTFEPLRQVTPEIFHSCSRIPLLPDLRGATRTYEELRGPEKCKNRLPIRVYWCSFVVQLQLTHRHQ